MASEQFSLCWDNFHKNMSTGMSSLLENEDLVDVTIAVEGQYLKAHKMVLSVCSPYFRELFKVNPCKHPIVFMKDVSYIAMSDLLQFMYQGEVQVSQDNLATFIKTAEALQVKGLTGDGNGLNECESETNESSKPTETEAAKPNLKVKKQLSNSSLPTAKRQKFSTKESHASVTEINEKKRPASPIIETTQEELISFKMEPYDQSQSITLADDASDNAYSEDQFDDQTVDDCTEDYAMIEDEEPKPGTSADVSTSHTSIAGVTSDISTSEGQGFETAVLNTLNKLWADLQTQNGVLTQMRAHFFKNDPSTAAGPPPPNMPDFPIRSVSAITTLNEQLKDKTCFDYLVRRLRCIQGLSGNNLTRAILRFIMIDEVASHFNWAGHNKNNAPEAKLAFAKFTNILNAITETISKNDFDMNINEINKGIKDWLKLARPRINNRKKN